MDPGQPLAHRHFRPRDPLDAPHFAAGALVLRPQPQSAQSPERSLRLGAARLHAAGLGLGLFGPARLAGWAALGILLSAASVAALDADLYAFFFRRGGARFALIAAGLHVGYLLYSSLVFVSLLLHHRLRGGVGGIGEQAIK